MKLIIFAVLLATVYAKPSGLLTYSFPFALSSQYHAQDTLGQYNYGYVNGLSSKAEVKSFDGITRGGYTYIDAEGKLQSVQYTSDAVNGFRVAASNLPVAPIVPKVEPLAEPIPVQDTPEVAAAKAQHFSALEEAKIKAAEPVNTIVTTAPVVQTYAYGINPVISYGYPGLATYAAPYYAAPYYHVNAVPVDTPEVAKAKAEHLAAVEEVKARN